MSMKISVSLPDADVAFLDDYAHTHAQSRSAALHEAVTALRNRGLAGAYAQAFEEWDRTRDGELWARAVGDGLE